MNTMEIINGLDKKELLKWEIEVKSILNELNWKLTKTSRALHLHQSGKEECAEKLKSSRQRAAETRMALQFLSADHPLRHKCEDDLYKTEISIFRLERKLQRFSNLKLIQLEIKKRTIASEIKYYEDVLLQIKNLLKPPVVLQRILNIPDGENIFNLQLKQEAIDVRNLFLSVGYEQEAIDVGNYFGSSLLSFRACEKSWFSTIEIQDFSQARNDKFIQK